MSSQTAFPETPQSPPAFERLGHCELAPYCDGGGMEMVWRYSLVLRLYSAHIPLVLPLYTYASFSCTSVSPPSPGLVLTALLWQLFERNRIFVPLQFEPARPMGRQRRGAEDPCSRLGRLFISGVGSRLVRAHPEELNWHTVGQGRAQDRRVIALARNGYPRTEQRRG